MITDSGEGLRLSPPAFCAENNWNPDISSAQNVHRGRRFCRGVKYSPVTPVFARDMYVLRALDAQQHGPQDGSFCPLQAEAVSKCFPASPVSLFAQCWGLRKCLCHGDAGAQGMHRWERSCPAGHTCTSVSGLLAGLLIAVGVQVPWLPSANSCWVLTAAHVSLF